MAELRDNGELLIGDYVLKFDRDEIICDEVKEIARKELRETPEVRDAAVAKLRDMLKDIEDFTPPPEGKCEDEILIRFLRPCKFYPDSALKKIKHYFALLYNKPHFCGDLLNKKARIAFIQELITIVPGRDQHSRCVFLVEVGQKWKPRECPLIELIHGIMLACEGLLISPTNQITGFTVIVDCKGLSLSHAFHITPSIAMTVFHYIQDCIPVRVKAVHFVNQSQVFTAVFAILKPFINIKLRSRMHFHGHDKESILKHVDARVLPLKYVGQLDRPHVPGTMLFDFLAHYKNNFQEIAALGYTKKPVS